MDRMTRDAVAVLAHVYLRFDRPAEAAALLTVLVRLDADPGWARRALCLAHLHAGRYQEAVAGAEELLRDGLDDAERLPLLHIAAKGCWRLGREDEARAFREAARATAAVTVLRAGRSEV